MHKMARDSLVAFAYIHRQYSTHSLYLCRPSRTFKALQPRRDADSDSTSERAEVGSGQGAWGDKGRYTVSLQHEDCAEHYVGASDVTRFVAQAQSRCSCACWLPERHHEGGAGPAAECPAVRWTDDSTAGACRASRRRFFALAISTSIPTSTNINTQQPTTTSSGSWLPFSASPSPSGL